MTRKLIIHIGSHKTGTSSIQHTLYKNKPALLKQGFTLFNSGPDGHERKSGNALTWVKFKLDRNYRIEGRVRKKLPAALAAEGDNVIISAETFSWIFSAKEINRLRNKLSPDFDDIKIVAYIRRQDMQAISQYQQASKHDAFVAARFYNGGTRALPTYKSYFQKYLNYHQRLGMWADAFGQNNLIIRIFESDQLVNGDAVDDFFQVTGLAKETSSTRRNQSSGFEKTKVGHLVSAQQFPLPVWKALTRHLENSGKLVPARHEAVSFYSNFQESNKLLNERFSLRAGTSLFNEDFSLYPVDCNDQWTENTANAAITNLLKGVKTLSTFEKSDIAFMRECAEKLEQTDIDSARKLLTILAKYNPDDDLSTPIINGAVSRIKAYLRQ
jgi:hypothetical protein